MNIKKFCAFTLIVINFSLYAMEDHEKGLQIIKENAQLSKQHNFLYEALEGSSYGSLVFNDIGFVTGKIFKVGYPINFRLARKGERINVSARNGFNEKTKQKSLVTALRYLYSQLAEKKFDVTALEELKNGTLSEDKYHVMSVSDQNVIPKIVTVNEGPYEAIGIPNTLTNNFELTIVSDVINSGKATREYLNDMHDFAQMVLAPFVNTVDGSRNMDLSLFFKIQE